MKRLLAFPLVLSGLLFMLAACGNGETASTDESGATENAQQPVASTPGIQVHETDRYTIEIPEGWNLDVSHRMNTELILFAPYDSTNNLFRENVNMLIDPVGDSLSLADYIVHAKEVLTEHMEGFGNYRLRMDEDRAWLYYDGEQQTMILHFTQMMAQEGNDIYILTFTSNASNTSNQMVAEDIMRSFRFK